MDRIIAYGDLVQSYLQRAENRLVYPSDDDAVPCLIIVLGSKGLSFFGYI